MSRFEFRIDLIIHTFFAALLLCFIFIFQSYADVESPSDAGYIDDTGPGFFSDYIPDGDIVILPDDLVDLEVSLYANEGFNIHDNIVIYPVSFNGTKYNAVFPASYAEGLAVTDSGELVNVSSAQVTGRLFSSSFSHSDFNVRSIVLAPVLNNPSSTVYSNRYTSWMVYYYESAGRLTNTTTYGVFSVTGDPIYANRTGDAGRQSLGILLLIFEMGVLILLCLKQSRTFSA